MVINFLEIVLEIILTPFSFGWMPSLKFNSGFKLIAKSRIIAKFNQIDIAKSRNTAGF